MAVFLSVIFLAGLATALLSLRRDLGRLRTAAALSLSLALFLVGMNIQARWVFFIASILLAATLVSVLSARLALRGLEVQGSCCSVWFTEGEVAELELSVRNGGRLARGPFLVVEDGLIGRGLHGSAAGIRRRAGLRALIASRISGEGAERPGEARGGLKRTSAGTVYEMDEEARIYVPRLGPGEEVRARVPRRLTRRGLFFSSGVVLRSNGLTGLASSLRRAPLDVSVRVMPGYREMACPPYLSGELPAEMRLSGGGPSGHSPDFFGVREYRRGDPLRFVHWRSSAKLGQLVVREFEREGGRALGLLIVNPEGCDVGPPGNSLMDEAARIAATLALFSLRRGGAFRLLFGLDDRMVYIDTDDFGLVRMSLVLLEGGSRISPAEMFSSAEKSLPSDTELITLIPLDPLHPEWALELVPTRLDLRILFIDTAPFRVSGEGEAAGASPSVLPGEPPPLPPGAELLGVIRGSEELETCFPVY